jgi:hypothetical protein
MTRNKTGFIAMLAMGAILSLLIAEEAQARGLRFGRGRATGSGCAYGRGLGCGSGTASGTGIAIFRRNGHLRFKRGTGTVSGDGVVLGTGAGRGNGSVFGSGGVYGSGDAKKVN